MKIGVGMKVSFGFGVIILIMVILGVLAILNMRGVSEGSQILSSEYVPEVQIANAMDRGALMTAFEARAYNYTCDENFYNSAKKHIEEIYSKVGDAEKLVKKSRHLADLDKGAKEVKEKITIYYNSLQKISEVMNRRNELLKTMEDNDARLQKTCYDYLIDQEKKLADEIVAKKPEEALKERILKIKLANDIIEADNYLGKCIYKCQIYRDTNILDEGIKEFSKVGQILKQMEHIVRDPKNIAYFKGIENIAQKYGGQVTELAGLYKQTLELEKKLVSVTYVVFDVSSATAKAGMDATQKMADKAESDLNRASVVMMVGLVLALAIGVVFAWMITVSVMKPINRAAEIAHSLASQSEELSSVSSNLLSATEQMSAQANNVAAATEQMSHNINSMASATEEMNVNAQNVAGASEQMSHNMANIAGAIEELSSSMSTVSGNADNGTKIASDAMGHSSTATGTMNKLGSAAQEIGQVTEVIKRIAEQTNLLALNATIEAASAGEAGKGFAVVANEIKELASQSANAAEDIAKKIKGIQNQTGDAVKVISEVSEIIGKLNESVDVISKLVVEQGKATNDMSRNVGEANTGVNNITHAIKEVAEGTREVSKNAGEAAKGANDVSSNIGEVKVAVGHTSSNASQVNTSATELSKLAGELNTIVAEIRGK